MKVQNYAVQEESTIKYFCPAPENLDTLKRLYKNLCFKHHPDAGGSDEAMKTINHEYAELSRSLKNIRFNADYKNATDKIKCIFTATREKDRAKLHLLKQTNKVSQWFICCDYDSKSQNWNPGTYFNDFKKALSAFRQKCAEYQFNQIFESYR
jgi:curved DNA-binding protein CbpA